jgi:hypothetical protein
MDTLMEATQHHVILIVKKDNSVLSEEQLQLARLIVEMVLLLELKPQPKNVMMEIKKLEMDVADVLLNHYGNAQENPRAVYLSVEMDYFRQQ